MKCDKCGYDCQETGDFAHVCSARNGGVRLQDLIQRLDGYRDFAQRLNVVEMQRDGLLAELRHCAEVFRQYEQLHLLKCTDEGLEKAHRNGYLAARAEAAIASVKEQGK